MYNNNKARLPVVIGAIVFVVVFVVVLVWSEHAEAAPDRDQIENTPGCISTHEWKVVGRGTMSQVEAQLGVTHKGTVNMTREHGRYVSKDYPWCNGDASEGDLVFIYYALNARGQYMSNLIGIVDWEQEPGTVAEPIEKRVLS